MLKFAKRLKKSDAGRDRQDLQAKAQCLHHNHSVSLRFDEDFDVPGKERTKLAGQGKWKSWKPTGMIRCTFANPLRTSRDIARSLPNASHKHIIDVQNANCELLCEQQETASSVAIDGDNHYLIYDVMIDDTQFDLAAEGEPRKQRHVMGMHGGLCWHPRGGEPQEEEVIIAPRVMKDSSSSVMSTCLKSSPVDFCLPKPDSAKFRGAVLLSDAVEANMCLFHNLVVRTRNAPGEDGVVPAETMVAHACCRQHGASNCMQPLTLVSKMINNSFCCVRVLSSSATCSSIRRNFRRALLEDLEIVDPSWESDPEADAWAEQLLECCYCDKVLLTRDGSASPEYIDTEQTYRRQRVAKLRGLLPGDWRCSWAFRSCRQR